jgi:outer membrane protein assembly factor BamB
MILTFLRLFFLRISSLTIILFILSDFLVAQDSSFNSPSKYRLRISTFLGDEQRNYYGNYAPDTLEILWKHYLGQGVTVISRKLGSREWAGAGWTGQPLLVEEDTGLFIIQGAYDHHLKKINASTGKLVWEYKFDDVVKGTGTIWQTPDTFPDKNRLVILQGSRLGIGNYLDSKHIPSFRAISYHTGEELWRLDVKWTKSYSRDADGSALVLNDTVYIGLENSLFTVLNPSPYKASVLDGMLQPEIIQESILYDDSDVISHKNNVVTESSPCLLDSVIYIASGSGHIFGYSLKLKEIIWDFFIGSDIDGSPVVTHDSCILVSIERQYIDGKGGAFKLNPKKPPDSAVIWYMPTENKEYSGWEGGIIGSCAVNDRYNTDSMPYLAAFSAIDGHLYVVNHMIVDSTKQVFGPDGKKLYYAPELVFKHQIGASISTPIIVGNKIIASGYAGVYLFQYDKELNVKKLAKFTSSFEATPVVHNGRLYIASRDGYFYCLGRKM